MDFREFQTQRKIASMEEEFGENAITDYLFGQAIDFLADSKLNESLTKEAGIDVISSLVRGTAEEFAAILDEISKEASVEEEAAVAEEVVEEEIEKELTDEEWGEIGLESQELLKSAGFDDNDVSSNLTDPEDAYALGVLSARLKIASDLEEE